MFSISTCVEYQTSDERSWRISSCLKAPLKQQCQAGTEEPFSLRKLAGSNKKSEEKKLNVGSQTRFRVKLWFQVKGLSEVKDLNTLGCTDLVLTSLPSDQCDHLKGCQCCALLVHNTNKEISS